MTRIVWVEDERELAEQGAAYLRREGCEVHTADSAEAAIVLIEQEKPQLLLVDWLLKGGGTGLDLCRRNERLWQLPILMVTARSDEFDRILALEIGADDYIHKPFSLRELHARIKAVLRRAGRMKEGEGSLPAKTEGLVRGDLSISPERFEASVGGAPVELTRTEFALLLKLASHPGRVFTRTHLLEEALGEAYAGYERTIDSHIRNLRRKLGDDSAEPRYIGTVYGVGYRFLQEERRE